MHYITTINVGGDNTAAYLYWDSDKSLDKLIIVSNKKAKLNILVEFDCKVIRDINVDSYDTFGFLVNSKMKEDFIYITLKYNNDKFKCIGYNWNEGTIKM